MTQSENVFSRFFGKVHNTILQAPETFDHNQRLNSDIYQHPSDARKMDIAAGSVIQASNIDGDIQGVDSVTHQTSESAEPLSASSTNLSNMASQLQALVNGFKIRDPKMGL